MFVRFKRKPTAWLAKRCATLIMMAAALSLSVPMPASALIGAISTATATLTAQVFSACTVTALPLGFLNYDPTQASPTNGFTTITVTCTFGTPYNVGLSVGSGAGATVTTRKMTQISGTATLNYGLYQDTSRSIPWGTTIGTNTNAGVGTGLPAPVYVYGQIPAKQTALGGSYSDTITVSLTY